MSRTEVLPGATGVRMPGIRAWRNALFVVFGSCGIALSSLVARIPTISILLALSTAQVGLLLSAMAIGSVVGLLAAGHVVSTFGSRKTIVAAFATLGVALAVASLGIAVLGSFTLSFAALIVLGFSMGVCDVAMNISGAANEGAIGRTVMPIYHAFFSIGTIIGAGLGSLAEALRIPLDLHISALAVVIIVAVLVASRFILPEHAPTGDDADAQNASSWRSRLAIWKDPRTILIGLLVLGFAFTEGSSNDWLAYSMVHGHGTDRAVGAAVYGVFVAAMTVGRLGGVRLLDRFGRVAVLRVSASLAGIGLLLFIVSPVLWVDIVAVALWGLGASLGFPVGMSAAADDPRKAAGRVSAVASIGYLAFLVGPPVLGFLGTRFGILHSLLLVLVLAALSGVVSFAARKPGTTSG